MTASPELLRPDNFTPPKRTPWGGRKLLDIYKRELELREPARSYAVVGESWEVSVDPDYPSVVRRTSQPLAALIAADPEAWLGATMGRADAATLPLLVKWLDTADCLSVQVHPPETFTGLRPGESGKWEAWCILQAEPGAGVHLGFRSGVSRVEVQHCAEGGGRMDALLNFIAVQPGDVFVIEPGTPHALGAGVTLLEPQVVTPGKSSVTYRFWDWNRRYDAAGMPAPNGAPRPLHIAESLAVTRWDLASGDAFVDACRRMPRRMSSDTGIARDLLIETDELTVERWQGSGELAWNGEGTFQALTCVTGQVTFATDGGLITLRTGESGVIPAATDAASVAARDVELFVVGVRRR